MMKRGFLLIVSAFLLGACALPVPVQLASWAIDGISLVTTHKSVADHGLSLITNEDCAMWRAVEGDDICSGNDAGSTAVAIAAIDKPEEMADFETATGPEDDNRLFESPELPPLDEPVPPKPSEYTLNYDPSEFTDAGAYISGSYPVVPDMPTVTAEAHVSTTSHPPHLITASLAASPSVGKSKVTAWFPIEVTAKKVPYATVATMSDYRGKSWLPIEAAGKSSDANTVEVKSGFYFVIGSFSKRDRAFSMAAKHILLKPKVAISRMDGNEINRVVVGPFAPGDKEAVHHRVRKDGIFDAWAARINPAKWSLLNPSESSDLAQLPP